MPGFNINDFSTLWFGQRLCIPSYSGLREEIILEVYSLVYSVHLGYMKM